MSLRLIKINLLFFLQYLFPRPPRLSESDGEQVCPLCLGALVATLPEQLQKKMVTFVTILLFDKNFDKG
jgi:hypothetical protein